MQNSMNITATDPVRETDPSLFSRDCGTAYTALERYETTIWDKSNALLSPKYAALIAMAVSLAIPCQRSARHYRQQALQAQASEAELAATAITAATLRMGGASAHGRLGLKIPDQGSHDASGRDSNRLAKHYMTQWRRTDTPAFTGWWEFIEALHKDDFPLPRKYFELMAFAVTVVTQCVHCIGNHSESAREFGASEEELANIIHLVCSARIRSTLHQAEVILVDADAG